MLWWLQGWTAGHFGAVMATWVGSGPPGAVMATRVG